MDNIKIEIPAPDFSFSDVIKLKASNLTKDITKVLIRNSYQYTDNINNLMQQIELECDKFKNKNHQVIYLIEFLNHLAALKEDMTNTPVILLSKGEFEEKSEDAKFIDIITQFQFFIYNLSSHCGYHFDVTAFSQDEVNDLNTKVDAILSKLNEVQLGQEIIFDSIDELKSDFQSLKTDFPLGKKRWYQRASGIVVSYLGTKGADEIFALLKPLIKELIHNDPGLMKLLSS